jgi:hypothetical protein
MMTGKARRVLMAAAVACVGAMAPAVAAADPVVPKGVPFSVDVPSGELCGFPVRLSGVNGQTLHDSGHGVIVFSGPFTVTVARLDANGAVLAAETFNISGPTRFKDGVFSVAGPNVILQFASAGLGPPFVIYTTGLVTFTPQMTIASRTGTITDVCALLS